MEISGERECQSCGTRWSYFETGSVECPTCGSVHSVGTGAEPQQHTTRGPELDLETARSLAAEENFRKAADAAAEASRSYCREWGFIDRGALVGPSERYVGAQELRHLSTLFVDTEPIPAAIEDYFIALLQGLSRGNRPPADRVPAAARAARGLAAATSARAFRRAASRWRSDRDLPRSIGRELGRLGDHAKRIDALDGDVPPEDADRLVTAAQALASAIAGEEGALETARARLDALEP